MQYSDFIRNKKHSIGEFGFEPLWMPEDAFQLQEHIIDELKFEQQSLI